jgi:hypothetical protein
MQGLIIWFNLSDTMVQLKPPKVGMRLLSRAKQSKAKQRYKHEVNGLQAA